MKQKLTPAQVVEIAKRAAAGEAQLRIAADYGCAQSLVSMIVTGKRRWLATGQQRERA